MSIWFLVAAGLLAWGVVAVALGWLLRTRRRNDSIEIPPFVKGGISGPGLVYASSSFLGAQHPEVKAITGLGFQPFVELWFEEARPGGPDAA